MVAVGPGVTLLFTEATADPEADAAMVGMHICVYIVGFASAVNDFHTARLSWTNPKFAYLDRCDTPDEALRCKQFRFRHLHDEQGRILELEHETRSMLHSQFFKKVYYTPK
jgi:hypothetical protein